jgi:hypothetical protein
MGIVPTESARFWAMPSRRAAGGGPWRESNVHDVTGAIQTWLSEVVWSRTRDQAESVERPQAASSLANSLSMKSKPAVPPPPPECLLGRFKAITA